MRACIFDLISDFIANNAGFYSYYLHVQWMPVGVISNCAVKNSYNLKTVGKIAAGGI